MARTRSRKVPIWVPEDVYALLEEYRVRRGFRDLCDVLLHLVEVSRILEKIFGDVSHSLPCRYSEWRRESMIYI